MYQHPLSWAVNLNPKEGCLMAAFPTEAQLSMLAYDEPTRLERVVLVTDPCWNWGFLSYNPQSLALLTTRKHQLELVPTSTTSQLPILIANLKQPSISWLYWHILMFLALGYQIRSASAGGLSLVGKHVERQYEIYPNIIWKLSICIYIYLHYII